MTTAFDILDQLEKISSTKQKLEILKANLGMPGLETLLVATFDYHRKYYMKQLPEITGNADCPEGTDRLAFSEILCGCERYGRGQDCKDRVILWLSKQHPQAAKWCRRVILRDLRCGVSIDTAIKAGFAIPSFELQLATDSNKCKKLDAMVQKGVMVSKKLDGYRCLAIGSEGVFTLYTRNGNVYENFPTIKAELERLFPEGDHVFDGEIMSDSFNDMQKSAFASKRKTTVGDVRYHVFDMIPASEWTSEKFTTTYFNRYDALETTISDGPSEIVGVVPHYKLNTLDEIREYQQVFESAGFEGAMANPDIPYYMGRKSNCVLKFKSMLSADCKIVGFVEGKGRLEGTLGKVLVAQENGKQGEVGSGFDDAERAFIWANQVDVEDRIIEVKFQEMTPDGYMRFPIFMRFRDQGDGSKI